LNNAACKSLAYALGVLCISGRFFLAQEMGLSRLLFRINLPLLFTVFSQVLYNWVSAFVVVRRGCDECVDVRPPGRDG
jgi:hypothetical protein